MVGPDHLEFDHCCIKLGFATDNYSIDTPMMNFHVVSYLSVGSRHNT